MSDTEIGAAGQQSNLPSPAASGGDAPAPAAPSSSTSLEVQLAAGWSVYGALRNMPCRCSWRLDKLQGKRVMDECQRCRALKEWEQAQGVVEKKKGDANAH